MTAIASTPSITTGRLLTSALISGALAAVANLIVYFISRGVGVPLQVVTPGSSELQVLPFFPVIFASLLPAFVAAGLYALLHRFTARPVQTFQIIAAVVLVLSFISPLAMPTDGGTKFVLNLMHAVAAGFITWGLTMLPRQR
jgi:hypothetical protein